MNIVYIDAQNVLMAIKKAGWEIDRKKLFIYLQDKYRVDVIYYAVGYISHKQEFYNMLLGYGYTMIYKQISILPNGTVKGNVDIDIAIRAVLELGHKILTTAYLITNDGDYNTLITTFQHYNVRGRLITPDKFSASRLIKTIGGDILNLQDIKYKIQKALIS